MTTKQLINRPTAALSQHNPPSEPAVTTTSIAAEERDLEKKLGNEYRAYKKRDQRWI